MLFQDELRSSALRLSARAYLFFFNIDLIKREAFKILSRLFSHT